MDPYLEHPHTWRSFHTKLIVAMSDQLMRHLPPPYYADVEEDLYIHEPSADQRRRFAAADAAVIVGGDAPHPAAPRREAAGATAITARMPMVEPVVPEKVRSVEIRTVGDNTIVSVVELLSRTNKLDGREQFLAKRERLREAGVHFLQIDLLRTGRDLLPQEPPPHDYNAMLIRRGNTAGDVWMWALRDALPILPVPLKGDDPDIALDLRAAMDATYDASRYERFIYANDIEPPLNDELAAWASGIVPPQPTAA
jgi:hypothetical protein